MGIRIAFRLILLFCLAFLLTAGGTLKRSPGEEGEDPKKWTCDPKADLTLKRHDYTRAILLHKHFLKGEPQSAVAFYHLGYAYGMTGDHEKEVDLYGKAIALGFTGAHIFFNLGMACGELNRTEESIKAFEKALQIDPDNADYLRGTAMAYQQKGDEKQAEVYQLKALRIDQRHLDARLSLSDFYLRHGKSLEAAQPIQEILIRKAWNQEALYLPETIHKTNKFLGSKIVM